MSTPVGDVQAGVGRHTAIDALPEFLHTEEAARFFGVSKHSIFSMIAGGKLPRLVVGRRLMVPRTFIEALARGENPMVPAAKR